MRIQSVYYAPLCLNQHPHPQHHPSHDPHPPPLHALPPPPHRPRRQREQTRRLARLDRRRDRVRRDRRPQDRPARGPVDARGDLREPGGVRGDVVGREGAVVGSVPVGEGGEADGGGVGAEDGEDVLEEGGSDLGGVGCERGERGGKGGRGGGRTTQLILEVDERVRSKNAPRQVEMLFVRPNGPRLKSSDVMLYR